MIIKENIIINGNDFIKHYSDKNVLIKKVGTNEIYAEAIDLLNTNFIYEETDIKIDIINIDENNI